jgi:hypothetical protein
VFQVVIATKYPAACGGVFLFSILTKVPNAWNKRIEESKVFVV